MRNPGIERNQEALFKYSSVQSSTCSAVLLCTVVVGVFSQDLMCVVFLSGCLILSTSYHAWESSLVLYLRLRPTVRSIRYFGLAF